MSYSNQNYRWHSVAHSVATFRNRFWITLALTAPAVFYSANVQQWLGYRATSFPGSKLIPAILGVAVFVYGGLTFVREAGNEIMDRKPGSMVLLSLAITAAFASSLGATFGVFGIDIWWELTSAITIVLLCRWLERRAVSQAWAICAVRFGNQTDLSI
jgi:Cu2+-exporting ATPase